MINFRKLIDNEEDYKLIYNWCSKRQVYEWFEQRILSYDEIVNKYKNKIGKQEVLIIEYENIPIGLIQIYKYDGKIDNYKNIYEYDLFIGENLLNKGIGSEVINLINRKIFFELHADLIVLRPFKRNERAIRCYTKCGFKKLYDYEGNDTIGNKEIISVYVKDIERWKFGMDNNKLIELILSGKKTATTSLLSDNISKIGDESIIMYNDNTDACLIKTTNVIITEFKNITEYLAYLEGEGDRSLEYYRKVHNEYFKTINPNFNDNTKVVFEIFEVIKMKRYNVIVVFDKDMKKTLMCKRTKEPYIGMYNLVGGKIEKENEGLSEAYRELQEETNISKNDISLIHFMNLKYVKWNKELEVYYGILNKDVILIEEVNKLEWVDINDNFFDLNKYAGEGNIGHIIEEIKIDIKGD